MKKPIRASAIATMALIPAWVTSIVLGLVIFLSTQSVYAILPFIIIYPVTILSFYGYTIIGTKLNNKLLNYSAWYSIIVTTVAMFIVLLSLGYFQASIYPNLKNIYANQAQLTFAIKDLNTTMGADELKQLSPSELIKEGLDPKKVEEYEEALAKTEAQSTSNFEVVLARINVYPAGWVFAIVFFVSLLPTLLLAMGIYRLRGSAIKYAKNAGVIGIVLACFELVLWISFISVYMSVTSPGAVEMLNYNSLFNLSLTSVAIIIFAQVVGFLGLAYFILNIMLLFSASQVLEETNN